MDNTTFYNYLETMPDVSTGLDANTVEGTIVETPLTPFIAKFVRMIATRDHVQSQGEFNTFNFDLRLSYPTSHGFP
jgi:hypothetical protein